MLTSVFQGRGRLLCFVRFVLTPPGSFSVCKDLNLTLGSQCGNGEKVGKICTIHIYIVHIYNLLYNKNKQGSKQFTNKKENQTNRRDIYTTDKRLNIYSNT